MNLMILLVFVFLSVFLVLAMILLMTLRTSKKERYRGNSPLLPMSKHTHTPLRKTVSKMLVMRPWPYKDIYNPLDRLYWPEEQADNRAHRRHPRRRRNR